MSKEPFEAMPDVMDAKQLAEALQISKAGAYNLLSSPDFPTLRIGGRKLVMKNELVEWLKSRTNKTTCTERTERYSLICGVNAMSTTSPCATAARCALVEKKIAPQVCVPFDKRRRRCFPPPTSASSVT